MADVEQSVVVNNTHKFIFQAQVLAETKLMQFNCELRLFCITMFTPGFISRVSFLTSSYNFRISVL